MNFIYVTMWSLQFFPWLLPNLMATIFCRVLGFPVWPEAWAGELWSRHSHLRAVWLDCHCGGRETARVLALPLHLRRTFPMPLGRISLSIVLRPFHQVTLCSPSLTFPANAWPMDWWRRQRLPAGWRWLWGPTTLVRGTVPLWIPVCISKHLLSFQVFKRTSEKSAQ